MSWKRALVFVLLLPAAMAIAQEGFAPFTTDFGTTTPRRSSREHRSATGSAEPRTTSDLTICP